MSNDALRFENKKLKLAVLFSGSGRTLENLAQLAATGELPVEISVAIGSHEKAGGHDRAARFGIPSITLNRPEDIWSAVRKAEVDLVILAGFLKLLPIETDFLGRVLNIHPSLLPSFGGKGMYGRHVHRAVIARGCKISGCTVHFCDNEYDTGPILVQRSCPVLTRDTAEDLALRVFQEECIAYPEAIRLIAERRVTITDRVTKIAQPPN